MNRLYKVEDQWQVGKYMVLFITPEITAVDYNAVEIDGKQYWLVPCSDLKDAVAIESEGQFEGKTIKFIKMRRETQKQNGPLLVRYIGPDMVDIRNGEVYEAHSVRDDSRFYGIVDRSGEEYAYSKNLFEIVDSPLNEYNNSRED